MADQGQQSANGISQFLLRVLAGSNAGAEALLHEGTTSLGSSETADLVIADAALEAEHFSIVIADRSVLLDVGGFPVWVDGVEVVNRSCDLAPFVTVKCGQTIFAVGPRNGEWPAYDPVDLLPVTSVSAIESVEDFPEEPAEQVLEGDGAALDTQRAAPAPGQYLRRKTVRVAAGFAIAILLVGGGLTTAAFYPAGGAGVETKVDARKALEAALAEAGMFENVGVESTPFGKPVVSGYVNKNIDMSSLRSVLRQAQAPFTMHVESLEQQVRAVETIVSQAGAPLTVTADEERGGVVLTGYLPDEHVADLLVRKLHEDVRNLRLVETDIVTGDAILSDTRVSLDNADLANAVSANLSGGVIRLAGETRENTRPVLTEVVDGLTGRWGRYVKFSDETVRLAAPTPAVAQTRTASAPRPVARAETVVRKQSRKLPYYISVVVTGEQSLVRDSWGGRYEVGDVLPSGYKIMEIGPEGVVTSRAGSTKIIAVRR